MTAEEKTLVKGLFIAQRFFEGFEYLRINKYSTHETNALEADFVAGNMGANFTPKCLLAVDRIPEKKAILPNSIGGKPKLSPILMLLLGFGLGIVVLFLFIWKPTPPPPAQNHWLGKWKTKGVINGTPWAGDSLVITFVQKGNTLEGEHNWQEGSTKYFGMLEGTLMHENGVLQGNWVQKYENGQEKDRGTFTFTLKDSINFTGTYTRPETKNCTWGGRKIK
jgi:hypothetical protein